MACSDSGNLLENRLSFRGEISSRFPLWFPKHVQLDFVRPTLPLGISKNAISSSFRKWALVLRKWTPTTRGGNKLAHHHQANRSSSATGIDAHSLSNSRSHHRHYPEIRGEGRTLANATAHLLEPVDRRVGFPPRRKQAPALTSPKPSPKSSAPRGRAGAKADRPAPSL